MAQKLQTITAIFLLAGCSQGSVEVASPQKPMSSESPQVEEVPSHDRKDQGGEVLNPELDLDELCPDGFIDKTIQGTDEGWLGVPQFGLTDGNKKTFCAVLKGDRYLEVRFEMDDIGNLEASMAEMRVSQFGGAGLVRESGRVNGPTARFDSFVRFGEERDFERSAPGVYVVEVWAYTSAYSEGSQEKFVSETWNVFMKALPY